MKRIIIMTLAILMISGVIFSEANAEDISFTLSTKVWSKYLGSSGAVVHDKPALQTDLFVALPKSFYFDIWHSMGLDGTSLSSDLGDEIDYTLGWNGKVKTFSLDAGISYFDIIDLFHSNSDAIQPYAEINRSFNFSKNHSFSPYARVETLFPFNNPGKGLYAYSGIKYAWRLTPAITINQNAGLIYDSGVFGLENGFAGRHNLSFIWSPSKSINFELLNTKITIPISSFSDRKNEIAFGAGLMLNF